MKPNKREECERLQGLLPLLMQPDVSEELDDMLRVELECHLDDCAACSAKLAQFRGVANVLNSVADVEAPADLTDRVFARILLPQDEIAAPADLTDRALARVQEVTRTIGRIVPLYMQLIRSGAAACFLAVIFAWSFSPVIAYTESLSDIDVCTSNLKVMGAVIRAYPELAPNADNPLLDIDGILSVFKREHPDLDSGMTSGRHICGCPASRHAVSYVSLPIEESELESLQPGTIPIAWCRRGNHREGRNVLFADGSVHFFDEMSFLRLRMQRIKKLRNQQALVESESGD